MMDDISHILNDLNEAQREAVTAAPGHQLILAGAGSGKTRVLVHRMAWLISMERISPYSLLAVTFTNKAAAEMRHRTEKLLGIPAQGLWVGTFHGICHRLLRQHYKEAGLPQTFQILDSQDQLRLIKRVLKSLDLDEAKWPAKQAQWFINARKDEGVRPQHIPDSGDLVGKQLIRIYSAYEELCHRMGVIDFAELLFKTLEILRDTPNLLGHYQNRFKYLLVDEFQDTNTIQYAFLRLLAGEKNFVFAVGDDDQSIYGWRGARIENIQHFQQHFPNVQLVKLEQNYRSSGNILKAANALIDNNSGRLGKDLWTDSGEGDLVSLYAAYNEIDEARFVLERIQQQINFGEKRSDIAILYRSNAQSRVFEEALIAAQIPYKVYGGLRFFERAEIKDALAYLRLTANRDEDAAFERIINQPTRGIGDRTLEIIRNYAKANECSMWVAADEIIKKDQLTARAGNAVSAFIEMVTKMSSVIEDLPLLEQVDHVIQASGLYQYFNQDKSEKSQARKENLDELVSAARGFEYHSDDYSNMTPLDAFLAHAVLESGETQAEAWEDCVQMMTMHSAKGLEFPTVFLCGLEEGLFPHMMSVEEPGRLEEERRLCYVAITRARRQLFLSYAETRRLHGRENYSIASRFINEIPEELLQELRSKAFVSKPSYTAKSRTTVPSVDIPGVEFNIGQRVMHNRFGEGVILNYEGRGSQARVQINFENEGSKWLVLAYAKLQVI